MTTPKLRTFEGGMTPLDDGVVLPYVRALQRLQRENEGDRPTADGTRMRASWAMGCARQLGMQAIGVEDVLEIDGETLMAFEVGQAFHDKIQNVLTLPPFKADIEVVASYKPLHDVSCHLDAVYIDSNGRVAVEIKSTSGFGFLLATGQRRSDEGPGPKIEHVCQAAIGGLAPNINADAIHIIYIDKDRHGVAEWLFGMDEQFTRFGGLSARMLAEQELNRMDAILKRVDDGLVPARHIPGFGRVLVPPEPDSRDQPWQCRYCRLQPICKQFGSDPFPIEDLGGYAPSAT